MTKKPFDINCQGHDRCIYPNCICRIQQEQDLRSELIDFTWKTFRNGMIVGFTVTSCIGGLIWLWTI